jgi:hypothetical protein
MPTGRPADPFPWALNDEGLALLTNHLAAMRPDVAVEFGSGKTTPILRAYANYALSLEHLSEWAEKTEQLCRQKRGLNWRDRFGKKRKTAELRVVTIGSQESPVGPLAVYDTQLPTQVDFALIDGPPKSIGRAGVMFQLFPSLTTDSVVWLDDMNRPEETEILALWQTYFPLDVRLLSERIAEIRVISS